MTQKKEIYAKANDMNRLLEAMNDKLKEADYRTKVQILTLTPTSWSRKYAAEYFNVSEYLIRTARNLRQEKGIISKPEPKRGKSLSAETLTLIEAFYNDDQYTRQLPGKKDYVSISKNIHKQKRFILCNLRELYLAFKEEYPHIKVGFSKFCNLRPKWCLIAGSSGTHSVCVCTEHQNAVLLVDAFKWDYTYKDLINIIVCDSSNKECMIHRCKDCPGSEALQKFLDSELEETDPDEEFHFSQWQTTDRATLITQTTSLGEYKELLIGAIDSLTTHSFIARCQGKHLKDRKENLDKHTALVLGDFAENYQFLIQDEIQSYHWSKDYCTLHPVVIYLRGDTNELQHDSFCFISDDNNHDTCFVYEVQSLLMKHIREKYSHIENIEYFSDGCAGQYKNFKNFLNLCYHKNDFALNAEWIFFATSHGKSPCDGIGGSVKRHVAKRSLQRPLNNQILTYKQMLDVCNLEIKNITFIGIDKEQMIDVRKNLIARFNKGKTIPGTRSYHHFISTSQSAISFKKTSKDNEVTGNFAFFKDVNDVSTITIEQIKVSEYISCVYDSFWWIGMVELVDLQNQDIKVRFMHPHGPSRVFHWPSRNDICFVPVDKILCLIDSPVTSTGRSYKTTEKDYDIIAKGFQ